MEKSYYTFPIRFSDLTEKAEHPRCDLKTSIDNNIYLIMTTQFHESRFDRDFGSTIWEKDFEIISNTLWKENIKESITTAILKYEKRLSSVSIGVKIDECEFFVKGNRRIKKRIGVIVRGFTKQTDEKFEFSKEIFVSPLSIE